MTIENVATTLFILGRIGIGLPRIKHNWLVAGIVFSIFPVAGLAITLTL